MSQKSYNNSPCLYLIPTPIGNMDDITLRAIKILNEVEVIFSEDTRITRVLLNHLNINKKLISSHKYNESENKEKMLEFLNNGFSVGIVTDRGTPIISDPGSLLVSAAVANDFNVVSLPGATAFVCALINSDISALKFTFFGFLNSKKGKRIQELEELKSKTETLIFYESPHRICETLVDMNSVLGNRKCSISREISKKFEEVYRGTILDVLEELNNVKGEIVIVLEGNNSVENHDDLTIVQHIDLYIKNGFSSKDAIKKVAKDRNVNKNDIYMQYHNKES